MYYYYQPYEQMTDVRQQPGVSFFPPGIGPGQNVERRLSRLERTVENQGRQLSQLQRTVERQGDRINRLNRRVQRLENQLGFSMTSDNF